MSTASDPTGPSGHDTLQEWLAPKLPARLGSKSAAVVDVILSQPTRASYGTVQEMADLAGVNMATVTRVAQSLGYQGWPPFQRELRARYLSHLSAPEVAEEHGDSDSHSAASFRRDLDNLAVLTRQADHEAIAKFAAAVAGARRTYVLGDGSYAALALAMAHNSRLAGYDVEAIIAGGSDVANRMAYLTGDDVLVVISFWRLYQTAVLSSEVAKQKGAQVFAVTDALSPSLEKNVDGVIVVPAEGASFFPSMTCGLAAIQALVTEIAAVDPARTRRTVAAAEQQWQQFSLLHRRVGTSG
jgi:DNA-binding MurR/RpiR family transcriptional regulator